MFSLGALAQGSIGGTVKDVKTGEAIIGANVVIQGTTIGSATDVEGNFLIHNVKEGTYTIVVSYVTYKTNTIPDVVVGTAKRVTLDIPLAEDVAELSEVVVTATRQTDTDFDLLKTIKENKLVVSGISAQQIARTLDRDAAQVMRRIPGVTIRNNEFVNVRGLSERYNAVMLHGSYAPSVETDIRSFSFSIIPSSQLDQLLVYKSPSADIPGDFAGGVIKVATKGIPDENRVIIDYSTQYRAGTTFSDFYHQQRSSTHFTGINTGYYDLPSGFPSDLRKATGDAQVNAGRSLKNLWTEQKSIAIPDQRLGITINRKFKVKRIEIGNITALTYSNAMTIFDVQRSDFNSFNTTDNVQSPIYLYNDNQNNQNIRTGVLFNWSFKFSDRHKIDFKNLFNQNSVDQFVSREGVNFESGVNVDNGSFDKVYRGIYSGQLLGTHKFMNAKTTVEWVAGYNKSNRDQPDYKRYRTDVDGTNGTKTLFVPVGAAAAEFLGRFYSKLDETSYSGGASINQIIGSNSNPELNPSVKAGFFFETKEREFKARNIGYVRSSSSNFNQNLLNGTIGDLFNEPNINNTTGIKIDEQSNPSDNYRASNKLFAYYAMADVPISKRFRSSFGVRIENNTQELNSASFTNDPVNVRYPVTIVLPSANLSYNFTDKSLVRVTYGKTLNRPEFRELAPFGFYDFNFNFTNKGNPNLVTAEIHNADLRWEYYPSKTESISVGAFYKFFNNPIETVFNPGSGSLGAKSFTYQNAKSAVGYGTEIEVKKNLTGLTNSKFVDRLSVLFNSAVIYSNIELGNAISAGQSNERPLQGQAPYIINSALFYSDEDHGFQVNLLHNVVGRNIIFVGFEDYPDLYLMPRHQIDLTINKRISSKFELRAGVSDLLNQDFLILQDGNKDKSFDTSADQIIQRYKPGQLFSIGFSWQL
ncbi:MAG: TonB-dependent receptor domain-containing protein [Flammeovirgaceae bacterium]